MNDKRRDILRCALNLLENASGLVDRILDEEQDSLDNTPENLMEGDRYQKREAAVERLEEAVEQIEEAKNSIEAAAE